MMNSGWNRDPSARMMLGHTIEPTIELRLPASVEKLSKFHLIVHIRDTLDCTYEYSLPSVYILHDEKILVNFIDTLTKATNDSNNNTIFELLHSTDRNTIGQVITSISHLFNEIYHQTIGERTVRGTYSFAQFTGSSALLTR